MSIVAPTDIAGCILWLDGADASSVTLSGANMTQWNDKSGNSHHATEGTAWPVWTADPDTGFHKAVFSSSRMVIASTAALNPTAGVSLFVMCDPTGNDFYGMVVGKDDGAWTSGWSIVIDSTAGVGLQFQVNGTQRAIATTPPTAGRHLLSGTYDKVTQTGRLDRVSVGSAANAAAITSNAKPVILGNLSNAFAGNRWLGGMCEVIAYNTGLGTSDRDDVEQFLLSKWTGRGNRPTVHRAAVARSSSW